MRTFYCCNDCKNAQQIKDIYVANDLQDNKKDYDTYAIMWIDAEGCDVNKDIHLEDIPPDSMGYNNRKVKKKEVKHGKE